MIRLGLNSVRYLCEKLNNPQANLKFIHIAGTNGKGSVGAYISTMLKEGGYTVGTYSSPAVFREEEIIRVNNHPITKADWKEGMRIIDEAVGQIESEGLASPTEFERQTALAYWYFAKKECDIVVQECGMGGLTDATNVVTNTLECVFTPISMDHMDYLGETIDKIAGVKAGIIKQGSKVITAEQSEEVLKQLEAAAKRNETSVNITTIHKTFEKVIALKGQCQIENASLAYEAIKLLPLPFSTIDDKKLIRGLHNTKWPGRFEKISDRPAIYLDGAHNEGAAKVLRASVIKYCKDRRIIEIVGMLQNKDHDKVLEITAPMADRILTVSTNGPRGYSAERLAQDALKYHNDVSAIGGIEEALELAVMMTSPKDVILVFGTLSLHKEVMKWNKDRHNGKV